MSNNLPPTREYTGARAAATEQMLTQVVVGSATPTTRRPRVRWVAAVAVAGVAVTAAAVAGDVFGAAADRSLARCHSTTDLGRGDDFAGTATASADSNGIVTTDRAIEACAELWRQGVLTAGASRPGAPDPALGAPVPALVGCVDSDGFAAVFPGRQDLCASLGLAVLVEVK